MARAYGRKITCAYAEPAPKPKRVSKPRPKLSDAEKAAKKVEAAARAEARKKLKTWEEGLKEWTGGDGYRGVRFVDGIKVRDPTPQTVSVTVLYTYDGRITGSFQE